MDCNVYTIVGFLGGVVFCLHIWYMSKEFDLFDRVVK